MCPIPQEYCRIISRYFVSRKFVEEVYFSSGIWKLWERKYCVIRTMIRFLSLDFLVRWKMDYGSSPDILCNMILNSAPCSILWWKGSREFKRFDNCHSLTVPLHSWLLEWCLLQEKEGYSDCSILFGNKSCEFFIESIFLNKIFKFHF